MALPTQWIHEFEQASGDSEGQEAWHTIVMRSIRAGHGLVTKQQY